MAVDEAILRTHVNGEAPPTLRFYGWKPAAVSLGYFQRAAEEINIEKCRKLGIDVVRRLTGGRAVLHDTELTYSIVVKEDHPLIPATITASYRYFSQGVLAGLRKLGIDAEMSMPKAAYGQPKPKHTSAACFDAPSQYEITAQGRKLVGSAQVRKLGAVLQHGSILLSFNPVLLASLLNLPGLETEDRAAKMLGTRAIAASTLLNRDIAWDEVYQAMLEAFGPALRVDLQLGRLSELEEKMTMELTNSKYSQDSWNLLR